MRRMCDRFYRKQASTVADESVVCTRDAAYTQATKSEICSALKHDADLKSYFEDKTSPSTEASNVLTLAKDSALQLHVSLPIDLSSHDQNSVMELFEINMKTLYTASKAGYNAKEKREELFNDASRSLIVRSRATGQLLAFSTFRFDTEETEDDDTQVEVVYCYEVQVSDQARGSGLGRLLMRCLESLARAYGLNKVMLTVFEANAGAIKFYKHLKYASDEICPSKYEYDTDCAKPDYLIMSRTIRAKSSRKKKKKKASAHAPGSTG